VRNIYVKIEIGGGGKPSGRLEAGRNECRGLGEYTAPKEAEKLGE